MRIGGLLPKAVLAACVLIAAPTLLLLVLGEGHSTPADRFGLTGGGGLSFLVAAIAFAVVGALIVKRVPDNAIGWIFCVIGLTIGGGELAYVYAEYALFVSDGSLPGGAEAAVLQNLGITPAFGLLGLALLLFPDGRLPSRRWRPAAAVAIAGSAFLLVGFALRAGPLDVPFESVTNPLGIGSYELMNTLAGMGWFLSAISIALAGTAMVRRLRAATGVARQQLKWIALAASLAGVVFMVNWISWMAAIAIDEQLRMAILGLMFAAFPLAAGIAVLRYRLYDIDVVINRTVVYGTLTATLAGTYLGSVLLLQLVLSSFTEGSGLAIAGSTLAVARVFQPARHRIQAGVDRRFFRRRYDASRTLERFAGRVRDEVDLDALAAELRAVVGETMQPAHVSLWLRAHATERR